MIVHRPHGADGRPDHCTRVPSLPFPAALSVSPPGKFPRRNGWSCSHRTNGPLSGISLPETTPRPLPLARTPRAVHTALAGPRRRRLYNVTSRITVLPRRGAFVIDIAQTLRYAPASDLLRFPPVVQGADMTTKYEQVKNIHKLAVETHDPNELRGIPSLLNDWGFKCREDDGELRWTNLSIPTSVGETITIGLRYTKRDESLTEDLFEISEVDPNVVTPHYQGRYQKLRSEYEGTHKQQDVKPRSFTSVNTCSLYFGDKNGS